MVTSDELKRYPAFAVVRDLEIIETEPVAAVLARITVPPDYLRGNPHRVMTDFIDALRSGAAPSPDFHDGMVRDQDRDSTAGSGGSPARRGRPPRKAAGRGAGDQTSGVRATRGAGPVSRRLAHLGSTPRGVVKHWVWNLPRAGMPPASVQTPEGMAP